MAAGGRLLDLVLPPRCPGCGDLLPEAGKLCAACWSSLGFLSGPACSCCGFPFPHDKGGEVLCGVCQAQDRHFDRVRSALIYDGGSRPLLLGFKHGDRTDLAPFLADLLYLAGRELLADSDLILPVPLHPRRLLRRRYNQAALLAGRLAHKYGLPRENLLLRRHRATTPQGGNYTARQKNVRSAFSIPERYRDRVQGRRILLVDDVYTTGATLQSCARELKKRGAEKVFGLTVARVVRPGML
ncbi:double zinc ribbon domain-containing protein [Emcibacter sp.]|uniref:double zinc ribbon domain-containing protein n=1 Tax=Emcibacter sp. TaxID=1979954 RepID=UPI003A947984